MMCLDFFFLSHSLLQEEGEYTNFDYQFRYFVMLFIFNFIGVSLSLLYVCVGGGNVPVYYTWTSTVSEYSCLSRVLYWCQSPASQGITSPMKQANENGKTFSDFGVHLGPKYQNWIKLTWVALIYVRSFKVIQLFLHCRMVSNFNQKKSGTRITGATIVGGKLITLRLH